MIPKASWHRAPRHFWDGMLFLFSKLEWSLTPGRLREQVMNLRKKHLENPWPPNDRDVGVILVAHSMGWVYVESHQSSPPG